MSARLQHATLSWLARRLAGVGVVELNLRAQGGPDGSCVIGITTRKAGSKIIACKSIEDALDTILSFLDEKSPAPLKDGG